jgi:hypothetical protein
MDVSEIADKIGKYAEADNIDYGTYKQVQFFMTDATRLILGIVFVSIFMLLALITVMDIAYLTIPTFRDLIYRKAWDGSREGSKIKLVSKYARNAVIEADTVTTGTSALGIYIKKRIGAWCLFITVLLTFLALYSSLVRTIGNLAVEVYLKFEHNVDNVTTDGEEDETSDYYQYKQNIDNIDNINSR